MSFQKKKKPTSSDNQEIWFFFFFLHPSFLSFFSFKWGIYIILRHYERILSVFPLINMFGWLWQTWCNIIKVRVTYTGDYSILSFREEKKKFNFILISFFLYLLLLLYILFRFSLLTLALSRISWTQNHTNQY